MITKNPTGLPDSSFLNLRLRPEDTQLLREHPGPSVSSSAATLWGICPGHNPSLRSRPAAQYLSLWAKTKAWTTLVSGRQDIKVVKGEVSGVRKTCIQAPILLLPS